jgi:adenosylcobinamide-GDP ribazoletransferase
MMRQLARCASMFTIIPVRMPAELSPDDGAGALLTLPVLGAVTGGAAALPAVAVRVWVPHAGLLGAVLAVAALAVATRGLHLDGLADTADGLGSAAPPARALEIMGQSDIGPFGVVTIVLVLAADIVSLSSVPGGAWVPAGVLGVAAATGRVAAVHGAVRSRAARPSGFGALVAGRISIVDAVVWTVAVLGVGVVVAVVLSIPPGWIIGPQLAALAAAWLLRRHAARRLRGMTGDVFGALIELATAITLIGAALR